MDLHDVDQELAFWPMYAMYAGMLARCTKVATIVASCLLGGRPHIDLASSAFRVGTCGLAGVENGRDIADRMQLEFNRFNWFNGMLGAQSSQSCAGVAGVP